MSDWIALATGPSAEEYLDLARYDSPRANLITCNGGLRIEDDADIYWVSDRSAMNSYQRQYREFSKEGGKIVAGHKHEDKLDVDHEVFNYQGKMDHEHYHGRSSGIMQVRYLLSLGSAEIIRLVGYDGYTESQNEQRRDINSSMKKALVNIFRNVDTRMVWYGPTGRLM